MFYRLSRFYRFCHLTLVTTLVALAAPAVEAQAQPSADEGAETPAPASDATQAAPDTEPPVDAPDDDASPFDYESSEEISRDLSVSFPVDI
jgi:hypothetical protein